MTKDAVASVEDALGKLNMSSHECERFEKAFKDEQFVKLFAQYAQEVQDPAARAETSAYLQQLEQQGQFEEVYGKGAQLITPKPEYVVKTHDEGTGDKVFINLCSSDKVAKADCVRAVANGSNGAQWHVPTSVCKAARPGADNQGRNCLVTDCTVHPNAIARAQHDQRFHRLLAEVAIERAAAAMQCKLSDKFKTPKMRFKGTPEQPDGPALTACKAGSAASGESTADTASAGRLQPHSGSSSGAASASSHASAASKKPSFALKAAKTTSKASNAQDAGFVHGDGSKTPAHSIIHSGALDLADAWSDSSVHAPPSVPRDLVIRIDLPGVTSAASAELDVVQKQLSLVVPGKYRLSLTLPFAVKDAQAKAKFEAAAQRLVITVPVIAPLLPSQPPSQQASQPLVSEVQSPVTEQSEAAECKPNQNGSAAAADASTIPADSEAISPAAAVNAKTGVKALHELPNTATEQASDAVAGTQQAAQSVTASAEHKAKHSSTITTQDTPDAVHAFADACDGGLRDAAATWRSVHAARDTADAPAHDSNERTESEGTGDAVPAAAAEIGDNVADGQTGSEAPAAGVKLEMALDFAFVDELD